MVVCERVFTIFLVVIIITTNAYTKYVEDSKCTESDSSNEQLEHLTEYQTENEINRTIPPTELGANAPCSDGQLSIEIIQSLPENEAEDQTGNQSEDKPKDQTEDEINHTIPPTECDPIAPCIEGYVYYERFCIPGLIIRITVNLNSDVYTNI